MADRIRKVDYFDNVTAMDAVVAGKGRYGAIFRVKPKSVARTAKLPDAR